MEQNFDEIKPLKGMAEMLIGCGTVNPFHICHGLYRMLKGSAEWHKVHRNDDDYWQTCFDAGCAHDEYGRL